MGKYVTDRIVKIYQDIITDVRKDLGKTIYIYYQTGTATTSDSSGWDPINEEPVNPSATTTYAESIKTINNVTVRWGLTDEWIRLPGGALEPKQCRLSMKLADVLIDSSNLDGDTYFHNCRKVVVDGIDCQVKSIIAKTGLRDRFNCRVIVEAIE